MVGNIIFYDFCSFWFMAVNTVDKLQFLSFITVYHGSAYTVVRLTSQANRFMEIMVKTSQFTTKYKIDCWVTALKQQKSK